MSTPSAPISGMIREANHGAQKTDLSARDMILFHYYYLLSNLLGILIISVVGLSKIVQACIVRSGMTLRCCERKSER